jgi:hypothetical protein
MVAGITDNRSLLEKADLALADLLSDGGLLQPAQAQTFMRLLIDEAVVMKMATVVPMRTPSQLIEKIKFGSRILRPGVEATALAATERVKPDLSKVELAAKLFKAEVYLGDETLEDNIEKDALRNTIMQMLGERIATDLDELILNGDTASADLFLKTLNGIVAQITGAGSHTVNATDTRLNKGILRDCFRAMPSPYLRAPQRMAFLTSIDAELDWRDSVSDRATPLGDDAVVGAGSIPYSKVAVIGVPMMPENVGTGSHCTYVIFCDPKNINVGVHREIRIETDRDISAGVLKVVASLRVDVKWAEMPATVKAYNVKAA